jgi:hypothetical protein
LRPQPGPKPDTTLLLKSVRHGTIQQPQQHHHQQQIQQLGHDSGGTGIKRAGHRDAAASQLLSGHVTVDGDSGAAQLKAVAGFGSNNRPGAWLLEAPSGRNKYGRDRYGSYFVFKSFNLRDLKSFLNQPTQN